MLDAMKRAGSRVIRKAGKKTEILFYNARGALIGTVKTQSRAEALRILGKKKGTKYETNPRLGSEALATEEEIDG